MKSNNTKSNEHHLKKKEIIFLTSELEGERASTFRQERWCKVFLEIGAIIYIYNIRGAFGLTSVKCNNLDEFMRFRHSAKEKYVSKPSVREGFLVDILRIIKHYLLIDLYLPNVILLYFKLKKFLNQNGNVVLMASSPPFSVALVAALLKRRYKQKITCVIDMRDAWGLHTSLGGIIWLKKIIEKYVMKKTDYVLTVSHGLKNEYEQNYNIHVDVMYNIATHYFNEQPKDLTIDWHSINPNIDVKKFKIIYTGSTPKGFYDYETIVSSISSLRRLKPEIMDRLQFIFVGACSEVYYESIKQGAAENDIIFVDHVPHDLAKKIQINSDALIFLAYMGEGNKGVVSTKIFEYLLLKKPILPISLHNNSDVDIILRNYCGTSLNIHSANDIVEVLENIVLNGFVNLPRLKDAKNLKKLLNSYYDFANLILE